MLNNTSSIQCVTETSNGATSELHAAADAVASVLREAILAGDLTPGTPLREVSLAEEFGVSRNTLRESIRRLAIEQLVDVQRHKGAVVTVMSTEDIRDLYIVRRTLELRAVDESALASPQAVAALKEACAHLDAASDSRDWRALATTGLRFHQAIVALLGSPRLDAMFLSVSAQIRLAFAAVADQAQFQDQFVGRDREICDFIIAGSRAAASAALRTYLDDSERVVADVVRLHSTTSAARR